MEQNIKTLNWEIPKMISGRCGIGDAFDAWLSGRRWQSDGPSSDNWRCRLFRH